MSQTQRDTTPTNTPHTGNDANPLPASQQTQVRQSGRHRTSVSRPGFVPTHQDSRRAMVARPVPESPSVFQASQRALVSVSKSKLLQHRTLILCCENRFQVGIHPFAKHWSLPQSLQVLEVTYWLAIHCVIDPLNLRLTCVNVSLANIIGPTPTKASCIWHC